ncbi:VOC family protein [Solirubrobacter phytolaccae]|uniref:VOC family protein n=1 Tax=Solirubrobacter phytolaccae TaxID=1404360 RepID=A0A9X3SER1_9ACTN|nr:VOC family protein [Solirubrobacter phytolaccae]MDA0180647.1 VOC family protein [Solirubrobacter phytolaccae]
MIDHVGIRVADRGASERFYDTVLSVLGLERYDDPEYAEWGDFALGTDGPVTRNLHVAFYAPTHALVDAFHRAGVAAGYEDAGAPGPRPQYRDDYYGAFLRDPDGNSVEAVHTGRKLETGAIDHLWLRTSDVAAVKAFYLATGHQLGVDEPDHVQVLTDGGSVSYVSGTPVTEHVHIAFSAPTNAAVDAFHAAATEAGYKDNGAPGERAVYHPGYYGAFVFDPDGHNVEAVNHNR